MKTFLLILFILLSVVYAKTEFYCYSLICANKTAYNFNEAIKYLNTLPLNLPAYLYPVSQDKFYVCLYLFDKKIYPEKKRYNNKCVLVLKKIDINRLDYLYINGLYSLVVDLLKDKNPSELPPKVLYILGMSYLKLGNINQAKYYLELAYKRGYKKAYYVLNNLKNTLLKSKNLPVLQKSEKLVKTTFYTLNLKTGYNYDKEENINSPYLGFSFSYTKNMKNYFYNYYAVAFSYSYFLFANNYLNLHFQSGNKFYAFPILDVDFENTTLNEFYLGVSLFLKENILSLGLKNYFNDDYFSLIFNYNYRKMLNSKLSFITNFNFENPFDKRETLKFSISGALNYRKKYKYYAYDISPSLSFNYEDRNFYVGEAFNARFDIFKENKDIYLQSYISNSEALSVGGEVGINLYF